VKDKENVYQDGSRQEGRGFVGGTKCLEAGVVAVEGELCADADREMQIRMSRVQCGAAAAAVDEAAPLNAERDRPGPCGERMGANGGRTK
jgi:hypothetical protein